MRSSNRSRAPDSAKSPLKAQNIIIRPFDNWREIHSCRAVQQRVWGFNEIDVVPEHVFVLASKTGGQVLGAFDGEKTLGFVLAFAAMRDGRVYLHSHMLAILPEHQDRGIGRGLKLAQRDDALSRGIELIEWTFDPLQIKNAYFNIARLGVIARNYLPDLYGHTSSPMHGGIVTDRLVAEWWLRSSRVQKILEGSFEIHPHQCERVDIPATIQENCSIGLAEAMRTRLEIQIRLKHLLASDCAVVGFELNENHGTYLLSRRVK